MTPNAISGSGLDQLIPVPGILEEEHVELAAPPEAVWDRIRHGDLAGSPFVQALFTVRTLPDRVRGKEPGPATLRLKDLVSTPERPGFGILVEDPPREICVGAIGKVWVSDIPFVHVADAGAYAAFDEPGYAKVAWALQVAPRGKQETRLTLELRVAATDGKSWRLFRRYFRLIGPGSRFIRRSAFRGLARELGRRIALKHPKSNPWRRIHVEPVPRERMLIPDLDLRAVRLEVPCREARPAVMGHRGPTRGDRGKRTPITPAASDRSLRPSAGQEVPTLEVAEARPRSPSQRRRAAPNVLPGAMTTPVHGPHQQEPAQCSGP